MSKINVYLSGNMTPSADYYKEWTNMLENDLKETEFECSVSNVKTEEKFIVRHDLARLQRCDIVVVNLSVSHTANVHLTGLVVELYEAFKQNKPVYAFSDKILPRSNQANSPWIQQFITKEFSGYDELLDHLLWEENLPN